MLQSDYLVDVNSLNSVPVLAPINLQTLSEAIANVQSSIITASDLEQTQDSLTTSIESAQSSIIDNTRVLGSMSFFLCSASIPENA